MGHLHHRLLAAGLGQRAIVLIVSGISALFGASALLLPNQELKLGSFILIGVLLLAIVWWLARRPQAADVKRKAPDQTVQRPGT
jgi:UDP-GlcNAc:undecaprenyl-phosphate GlcNAc-1-phosphate transferase